VDGLTAKSRPYPWPWHGVFDPRRAALLVLRDGDAAPPDRATGALLRSLVELGERAGLTVMELPGHSPHTSPTDFGTDIRMVRPHFGGFSGTDLDVILRRRGITDLILAGFPFELGADCTMRQANDLGYECLALTDCCSGLSADTLAGAMSSIQMSGGIFGAVAETSAVLDLIARACAADTRHLTGETP
jgi:biuret amidohydrolase